MQITPDLLRKHYQGDTSVSESKCVDDWLNNDHVPEVPFPVHFNEEFLQTSIWRNILAFKQKPQSRILKLHQLRYGYGLAASICVIIASVLLLITHPDFLSQTVLIDNEKGDKPKCFAFSDFNFTVPVKSKCEIKIPLYGDIGKVRFCGAVSVLNTSKEAKIIKVSMDLDECRQKSENVIKIKKGDTYLALTDDKYGMVSATMDEIVDGIPRYLNNRITKKFNLFI